MKYSIYLEAAWSTLRYLEISQSAPYLCVSNHSLKLKLKWLRNRYQLFHNCPITPSRCYHRVLGVIGSYIVGLMRTSFHMFGSLCVLSDIYASLVKSETSFVQWERCLLPCSSSSIHLVLFGKHRHDSTHRGHRSRRECYEWHKLWLRRYNS